MKSVIKFLSLSLLAGGLWVTSAVLASDLPDLNGAPQAQSNNLSAEEHAKRDAVCTKCHDESETKAILSFFTTKHGVTGDSRTPTCQSCHGESDKHVHGSSGQGERPAPDVVFGTKATSAGYIPNTPKEQSAVCLTCHGKDNNRTHWEGAAHQVNDVACTSCHENHTKNDKVRDKKTQPEVCFTCHKEQRAQSQKISHHPIGEGKVVCSDCHNPHGSAGPKLLKKNTVTETCFTCHAEKRGPFLFEHQPVVEDCLNCHNPHGSNITPLLKSRPPFLCDECHDGPHASSSAPGTAPAGKQGGLQKAPSANYVGNACMNCHRQIHGSNSPAGGYLQR